MASVTTDGDVRRAHPEPQQVAPLSGDGDEGWGMGGDLEGGRRTMGIGG